MESADKSSGAGEEGGGPQTNVWAIVAGILAALLLLALLSVLLWILRRRAAVDEEETQSESGQGQIGAPPALGLEMGLLDGARRPPISGAEANGAAVAPHKSEPPDWEESATSDPADAAVPAYVPW